MKKCEIQGGGQEIKVVWIQWNGMVEWNSRMEWNGRMEWNDELQVDILTNSSPSCDTHLRTKTAFNKDHTT